MPNVRNEIEIVLYKNGRLIKHPSGVEVFEPLEVIQARATAIDEQIASLTSDKVVTEKIVTDCGAAKDSASAEIVDGKTIVKER